MRKQDYLVGLIAAMGPNEKRYFKLFGSLQPGEKRYLKLFDALEHKKKYDGAELCAELGLEPWQLADDKHYLTQTLLQSLRNYDQESSELAVLRNNKENVQSLINRRMFSFAADLIEKIIEDAYRLEAFELIDALLIMRSSCWQNKGQLPEKDDTLDKHSATATRLNEVVVLMDLRRRARALEIKAARASQFEKILAHALIKGGIKNLHSLRAKSLYYETLAHYYSTCIDDAAVLRLAREERALYLKHPEIKSINPIVYLTNLFRLAHGEADFEVREQIVGSLQKELANPDIKISNQRRESLSWGAGLMSLWNLRNLHRFKEALPVAEKLYQKLEGRSEYDRYSIGFEYALILLHNNQPDVAAGVIDELLRIKTDVRSDLQTFVRLMHVMAQLSMGNYEVVPHVIKGVRFWLKKNDSGNKEIDLFFKHAGLLVKAPHNKRPGWQALLKEIEDGKLETMTRLMQFDKWVLGMRK